MAPVQLNSTLDFSYQSISRQIKTDRRRSTINFIEHCLYVHQNNVKTREISDIIPIASVKNSNFERMRS